MGRTEEIATTLEAVEAERTLAIALRLVEAVEDVIATLWALHVRPNSGKRDAKEGKVCLSVLDNCGEGC